ERVLWLKAVGAALAAAHARGLVHRDVKPENVMIREDGVVKVLDFGIAQRAAEVAQELSTTSPQTIPSTDARRGLAGTPYYMSPEQMRREEPDARTAQFAWGVVAYELLTGSGPWHRDGDAMTVVAEVLGREPTPIREEEPAVPRAVADAVMRALAKK